MTSSNALLNDLIKLGKDLFANTQNPAKDFDQFKKQSKAAYEKAQRAFGNSAPLSENEANANGNIALLYNLIKSADAKEGIKLAGQFFDHLQQQHNKKRAKEQQQAKLHAELDNLKDFAVSEQIGHNFVYKSSKHKNSDLIKIKEQDGVVRDFFVYKIATNDKALVAEIYIPCKNSGSKNIHVAFAGTRNIEGAIANLEPSPGYDTYRKHEQLILKHIEKASKHIRENNHVEPSIALHGHDLGGSYAQLAFHSLQKNIANKVHGINTYKNTLAVKNISVNTWNALGVPKVIADESNKLAPMVKSLGYKQKARFGIVSGDGLQQMGESNILSDVNHQDCDTKLLKVNNGYQGWREILAKSLDNAIEGATIGAGAFGIFGAIIGGTIGFITPIITAAIKTHSSHHFSENEKQPGLSYELYRNDTPEGRKIINKKLNNKSAFLKSSTGNQFKLFAQKAIKGVKKIKDTISINPLKVKA